MQKRGTVLVHSILRIEIYLPVKFQVDTVSALCSGQNIRKCLVKQLGQLKPNFIWHRHGIGDEDGKVIQMI